MDYSLLLWIAVILLSTKILGLTSEKVHMPQVVGALLAGIIIGPCCLGVVHEAEFLTVSSEIGVIILMFIAGLDTDLRELKKCGMAAMLIAVCGVIVPLLMGMGLYLLFFQGSGEEYMLLKAGFIGVILMATSVSITVEALREMGKFEGRMGTSILGAAIIDDVLGIIALTLLSSFSTEGVSIGRTLGGIGLFFVFLGVVAFVIYHFSRLFPFNEYKHRTTIVSFAFCLLLSYVAEEWFGVADITGAYFAGLILCNCRSKGYIAQKMTVLSYAIFAPIFFANIGIKTDLSGVGGDMLLFALLLTLVAIVSKLVGGSLGAKLGGFNNKDALSIGIGMVCRGEVALVVADKGVNAGLVNPEILSATILMVIVTTVVSPIFLKLQMK